MVLFSSVANERLTFIYFYISEHLYIYRFVNIYLKNKFSFTLRIVCEPKFCHENLQRLTYPLVMINENNHHALLKLLKTCSAVLAV